MSRHRTLKYYFIGLLYDIFLECKVLKINYVNISNRTFYCLIRSENKTIKL